MYQSFSGFGVTPVKLDKKRVLGVRIVNQTKNFKKCVSRTNEEAVYKVSFKT